MKRSVKIIILFVTILLAATYGRQVYQELNYNKQSYHTDIYTSIPSGVDEVICITRKQELEDALSYREDASLILLPLQKHLSYPILLSSYETNNIIITFKTTKSIENTINQIIVKDIAAPFPPKKYVYKHAGILTYSLAEDKFISSTSVNGILAISNNAKMIEEFVDTNPNNSFFADMNDNKGIITKIKTKPIIGIFLRTNNGLFALKYNPVTNDSIECEGYILNAQTENESIKSNDLISEVKLPKKIRVKHFLAKDSVNPREITIILSKEN